jgi:Flp pilus assembly protein TadD
MIARVALVAAAVAAIVLLAGDLRTARDVERATELAGGGPSPARVDEALALLRGAAARTDDTTPLVRAAELQLFAGRPEAALGAARQATRREPENARAWLLTAQAAARLGDDAVEAAARRRLAELVAQP